ncbi:MAG: transporter substrate-binding domain-containing protein [Balneolales bacterium]|nr:transporter substrate-binding domain-containing protein [Balneolales bacterium]
MRSLIILGVFALTSISCNINPESAGIIPSDEPLSGSSWSDAASDGSGILTAIYVPASGFAYTDSNGNLTGVVIDILAEFHQFLADSHSVNIDIQYVEDENWSRFYERVVNADDGVIGMGNVTITEARRGELMFSPPYMTNIAALITHRDAPELTSVDEISSTFSGRAALAFEGTLHESRLIALLSKYYPDAAIETARSNDEIVNRVAESDRYFAYIDIYNYWRATQGGISLQRHEAADLSSEEFGYIMPLDSSWGEVIEEFFAADGGFLQSDRYREIMETHLGEYLAGLLIEQ